MNYMDLLNYILLFLYKMKIVDRRTGFMNMATIIREFKYPASPNDLFEITKYLESLGHIRAIYTLGNAFAEISASGIVLVERELINKLPDLEKLIPAYFPEAIKPEDITNPTEEQIQADRKPLLDFIEDWKKMINEKLGVSGKNYISDLEVLKLELGKLEPDKDIIAIKLRSLSQITITRHLYSKLVEMLNI